MPARKRHRRPPEHPDPLVRFNRALQERQEAERQRQIRLRAEREDEQRRARQAAEHAEALAAARRDVDTAIARIKADRAAGRPTDDADAAWKAAKVRLIELETGEAPRW